MQRLRLLLRLASLFICLIALTYPALALSSAARQNAGKVIPIPGFLTGPPMSQVVIRGEMARAISVALISWQRTQHHSTLVHQSVMVTQGPRIGEFYVRVLPDQGDEPSMGCCTKYGADLLYLIDARNGRILQRTFGM